MLVHQNASRRELSEFLLANAIKSGVFKTRPVFSRQFRQLQCLGLVGVLKLELAMLMLTSIYKISFDICFMIYAKQL